MALIGKIRKNSWILVVMVGLGLGGFILMDMTSGQQSVFGGNQLTMGSIDGEDLSWNRFSRVEQLLYSGGGDVFSRRNFLWNYFIEETLVNNEAEELGLGVSVRELKDLEFGANPSPIIQQRFRDPTTGQLNREILNNYKQQIENRTMTDPNLRAFWAHQEKEIIKDRLQSKLNMLVSQSIYTPSWMAKMGNDEINQKVDFAYVKVPFDVIDNTDIALGDNDFETFIKENKSRFETEEETRDVRYVVFDVLPTASDTGLIRDQVADLVTRFEASEDDSLFVETNLGFISASYFTEAELTTAVNPTAPPIFSNAAIGDSIANMSGGEVLGPIADGNSFAAVKVIESHMVSDSADTRHILINATTPDQFVAAEKTVDSLINLLETRQAIFDTLALKFSQDPGSKNNGGKYENVTPNQFVPEFNKVLFVTGNIGEYYSVRTQFGIHLVEVLKRSSSKTPRYQIAYVKNQIVPSEETQNNVFDKVQAFISNNRLIDELNNSVSGDNQLNIESANNLKENDYIVGTLGGDQASRDIIKWAFSSKSGKVSPEIYSYTDPVSFFVNKYVVAALNTVNVPGLPPVASLRDEIEPEVMNQKKGTQITSAIQGKSMSAIASDYDVSVDTARTVSFSQGFIPNIGNEPKLIAKLFTNQESAAAAPVTGNSGVYLYKVLNKSGSTADPQLTQIKKQISSQARLQVNTGLIESLKRKAKIEDMRSKFY